MIDIEVNMMEVAAAKNSQLDRLKEVLLALSVPIVYRNDHMNAEEYVSGL